MQDARHERGALLYDPSRDKVGEYQDRSGPYAMLRPVGGGREWQADPAALRPATAEERRSAGVRAANRRARTDAPFLVGIGTPRPPVPEPGCAGCEDLASQRESARAAHDRSAETDANVLLRGHLRREHGSGEHGNDECRAPEGDPALASTDEETRDQQPIRRPAR